MITYKIYPLPGISDKSLTGSFGTDKVQTLGGLLGAISEKDGVDFSADVPFLAVLDGKVLDISENRDRAVEDGSELLILPTIMGG